MLECNSRTRAWLPNGSLITQKLYNVGDNSEAEWLNLTFALIGKKTLI